MTSITAEQVFTIAPSARKEYVDQIVSLWPKLAKEFGIRDKDAPHFLAQTAAETGGFNRLEENLFYTTIKRIRQVWPSRFKSDAAAAPYVRQPQKLANHVYGGRYGNTGPNDGWFYRGSGLKQTTFKTNYQAVERATGLPVVRNPDMLRSFPAALASAMVYWRDNKLSRIVDAGGDVVKKLTKAIQGGAGGLEDRRIYTNRALKVFNSPYTGPTPASVSEPRAAAMLRFGSKGDQVRQVQQRLRDLGYSSVGAVDGDFGDATEDAVKLFQARYGLVADGVVGPNTIRALNNARPSEYRDPKPLREPSGLDRLLTWFADWLASITRA